MSNIGQKKSRHNVCPHQRHVESTWKIGIATITFRSQKHAFERNWIHLSSMFKCLKMIIVARVLFFCKFLFVLIHVFCFCNFVPKNLKNSDSHTLEFTESSTIFRILKLLFNMLTFLLIPFLLICVKYFHWSKLHKFRKHKPKRPSGYCHCLVPSSTVNLRIWMVCESEMYFPHRECNTCHQLIQDIDLGDMWLMDWTCIENERWWTCATFFLCWFKILLKPT